MYPRAPAGKKVRPPLGPFVLPSGLWSAFAELDGELLFGASTGHVYRLVHDFVNIEPFLMSFVPIESPRSRLPIFIYWICTHFHFQNHFHF